MEESKELQGFYKIFRTLIYVSILMEFFAYALQPEQLDFLGGIITDIHSRIRRWVIYNDGNLVYSKCATFLLICITCVGTRNKKHLEFDARRQVLYPLVCGVLLIALSVWLFGLHWETRFFCPTGQGTLARLSEYIPSALAYPFLSLSLNIWLYMLTSIVGVVLIHIALDNISKFLKEGLLKDRFNFENESFVQCEKEIQTPYSVNIPMRYYFKGLITLPQVAENQLAFRKVSLKETNEKQICQKLLFYRFSVAKVQILSLLNECFGNNVASIYRPMSKSCCLCYPPARFCNLRNSNQTLI
jgi:hypothetical protein